MVASLIHRSQVQCSAVSYADWYGVVPGEQRWPPLQQPLRGRAVLAMSPVLYAAAIPVRPSMLRHASRHPREATPSYLLPIRLTKNLYSSRWQYVCYCLWDCRKRCYGCQGPMQHSGSIRHPAAGQLRTAAQFLDSATAFVE